MARAWKILIFVVMPLLIATGVLAFYQFRNLNGPESVINNNTKNQSAENITFTHQIFDPKLISHITPLGELNGGYQEVSTIAGIMVNIKHDVVANGKMIDVFAPAPMTLEAYSYHNDPRSPGNIDWTLVFELDRNTTIKFDHITQAVEKIVSATTTSPTNTSTEEPPKQRVTFAAGEKIAQTHGTSLAKNWNIYMNDSGQKNIFVNQNRYQGHNRSTAYRLLTAVCPFIYYPNEMQTSFLALMGATKAGQSPDCGKTSKDVAGTLSGIWHFNKEISDIREERDGQFVSPLSVYRNSANQVIIADLGDARYDLDGATDPTTIKDSYCYALTNRNNGQPAGWAFFKLVSETEMQLAYSTTGSCPSVFPTTGAKTYYR